MATAFRSSVREYVPESDRALPENERTVFLLRSFDVFDKAAVWDAITSQVTQPTKAAFEGVRAALKGWRNFKDESGNEVAFVARADGYATDESMRMVRVEVMRELLGEVNRYEQIGRDEAGKSLPPST